MADEQEHSALDLSEVMAGFGIREWENLGPTEFSREQAQSLLIEIDNRQRAILRERPEGMLGEDLRHRYVFQEYLAGAGIPVLDYWQTQTGEYSLAVGDDHFELLGWPSGEFFSTANPRALKWIADSGQMLARIHQASQAYPGPVHRWPLEAQPLALADGMLELGRQMADLTPLQPLALALQNWVDQWGAVLPEAAQSLAREGISPEFHLHGEYHALNLRFDSQGVTAVMGLEASRWGQRLYDLAYALFHFAGLDWQAGSGIVRPAVSKGLEPERIRAFLHAYGELCPPFRGEATLLTDALLVLCPLLLITGPLEDLFYPELENEALIDDQLERLQWAISLPQWLLRVRRALSEMWA